jgi:hypothetical protein
MPGVFKKAKSIKKKISKSRVRRYMKKIASGKKPRLTLDLSKKDNSVKGRMLKEDTREVLKGDDKLRDKVFRGEMTMNEYNTIHKNGL